MSHMPSASAVPVRIALQPSSERAGTHLIEEVGTVVAALAAMLRPYVRQDGGPAAVNGRQDVINRVADRLNDLGQMLLVNRGTAIVGSTPMERCIAAVRVFSAADAAHLARVIQAGAVARQIMDELSVDRNFQAEDREAFAGTAKVMAFAWMTHHAEAFDGIISDVEHDALFDRAGLGAATEIMNLIADAADDASSGDCSMASVGRFAGNKALEWLTTYGERRVPASRDAAE